MPGYVDSHRAEPEMGGGLQVALCLVDDDSDQKLDIIVGCTAADDDMADACQRLNYGAFDLQAVASYAAGINCKQKMQ